MSLPSPGHPFPVTFGLEQMAEVGGAQLASQATTPMKFPIKGEGALRKWPVQRPVHTASSYHLTTSLGPPEGIPGVEGASVPLL